ncbi:polysaccharide deacetylase family protein [Oryzibacter oryziterrae]|uniref:polysaccharide deacetylase family protein n=1 Tax=Oryzibacter oryziterrae TaxID=2766474 RepID=UPI001F3623EF|nr:polysaccharide deacetylase family protein [Oryzibacter oryziterrae]
MKHADLLRALVVAAVVLSAGAAEAALVEDGAVISSPATAPLPPVKPVVASGPATRHTEPLPAFMKGVKATGSAIGSAAEATVDATGEAVEAGWSATRSGVHSVGHSAHKLWRRTGIPQLFN